MRVDIARINVCYNPILKTKTKTNHRLASLITRGRTDSMRRRTGSRIGGQRRSKS
jgi:hypothetical protein